jgi:hypothetical protein
MKNVTQTLAEYGAAAITALKADLSRINATGETADSLRFEVKSDDDTDKLVIYAREFFSAIETGRGPRKSSQDGGFKDSMLEYMKARGIGSELDPKKREQLAKFLVWKINKEGDKTFKQGGRIVYTPTINKLVDELKKELRKDYVEFAIKELRKGIQPIKKAA